MQGRRDQWFQPCPLHGAGRGSVFSSGIHWSFPWIPVQGVSGIPWEVELVPATPNLGLLTFAVLLWMLGTRGWDQGMQQAPA